MKTPLFNRDVGAPLAFVEDAAIQAVRLPDDEFVDAEAITLTEYRRRVLWQ